MAFNVGHDTFQFDPMLFSGGKERVTVNGDRVYEGTVSQEQPAKFEAGGSQYEVHKVGKAYRIRVTSWDGNVVEGIYDKMGIEVSDEEGARASSAVGVCVVVGVVFGVAFMIIGNLLTGFIPGGAIGGGIGAGLGASLGGAVGKTVFARD